MMDGFATMPFMPGVLFAEDFDDETAVAATSRAAAPSGGTATKIPEESPSYSETELQDAIAIARDDGFRCGREEAIAGIERRRVETIEAAARSLAETRAATIEAVEAACDQIAAAALTLLLSYLPALGERFAADQIRHALAGFARSTADEGKIVIAVHPAILEEVGRTVPQIVAENCEVAFRPDHALGADDLTATWRNGRALRDGAALRRRMKETLKEAGLFDRTIFGKETGDTCHAD